MEGDSASTNAPPSGRLISKRSDPPADGLEWLADPGISGQETMPRFPGARAPSRLVVPAKLGPYAIKGEIARGGMGIVLQAFHTRLHRDVAVKLLRPEAASDDPLALERFMREAQATAKLRHAGIVAIHDVVHDERGQTYLVMDYVRGQSLKQLLAKGPLSPQRAAEILRAVGRAVAHAHEHKILHRDLKPDNVLIDEQTQAPLLTDFGLAKGLRPSAADSARLQRVGGRPTPIEDANLTQVGEVIGTPLYMAPEQIDPDIAPPGPATDIYALGAVLYECLTGRPPFLGESVLQIFERALRDPPASPRSLNPLIPASLEAITLRCLSKEPQDRFVSAKAFADELDRFLAGSAITHVVRTDPRPEGGRAGLLLTCSALLLGGAWFFGLGPGRARVAGPAPGSEVSGGDDPAHTAGVASQSPLTPEPTPTASTTPSLPYKLHGPSITLATAPVLAREGFVDAQTRFGVAILRGKYPAVAKREGIAWLERAANAGYAEAIRQLAAVYQQGIGVPQDPARELHWLQVGAEKKLPTFALHLSALLSRRGESSQAEAWLERAVAQDPDDPAAALALGNLVKPRDAPRAVELWTRAAELGEVNAMLHLAVTLQTGSGVKRDPEGARAWLTRATGKNDRRALYLMGRAYEKGLLGLRTDAAAARRWYTKAAERGHPEAQEALRRLER